MRFSPKQKLIATVTVSAVALGACLWGFWVVANGVLRDDAVRADIVARLDALAADRAHAQAVSALRALRQEDSARVATFFIDRTRPIQFLQALESVGRVTGAAVAIDVNDAGSDATHLGFRVIIEGGRQDMVRFLRILERLPYLITVTEINEERKSPDARASSDPSDRLVVSLRVRTQ